MGPPVEVSTRAIDLVLETTVIDMLGLLTLDWPRLYQWLGRPNTFGEEDFRYLELLGVSIFHPAVETGTREPRVGVDRWLRGWERLLRFHPCFLEEVTSVEDLSTIQRRGKRGVIVGFQNSTHFEAKTDVEAYFERGQRLSQLTYNFANELGNGCFVPRDRGLTELGIDIVGEMNRVGMAIDVSHCGERTSLDAIAASSQPVLVTHSNCAAVSSPQPRCKSDRVLRAMAEQGGVIGMTVVRPFVKRRGRASLGDLLDHFDYATRLIGIEHVGLGSDVDPLAINPETGKPHPLYRIDGLEPSARVFQIVEGLLGRGYTNEQLRLILGENFRRALAEIWPEKKERPRSGRELRRDPFCPAPSPPHVVRRS